MKTLKLVALIALIVILPIFIQLWLWRVAVAPVTHFAQPSFWQMVGIDVLLGAICGAARGRK